MLIFTWQDPLDCLRQGCCWPATKERGDGKHQDLCREGYSAKGKYNWSVLLNGTKAIW